jgi:hypothetical protein
VDTARQGVEFSAETWLAHGVDFPVPKFFRDLSGETPFSGFTDYQKDKLAGLPAHLVSAFFTIDQLWKKSLYELKRQSFPNDPDTLAARIAFIQFAEKHPFFQDPVVSIYQPPKWLWRFLGQVPMIVKARPESGLNAKLFVSGSQSSIDNGVNISLVVGPLNNSPGTSFMSQAIKDGMQQLFSSRKG